MEARRVAAWTAVVAAVAILSAGLVLAAVHGPQHPELLFPGWNRDDVQSAAAAAGVPIPWIVRYQIVLELLAAAAVVAAATVLLRGGRMSGFRVYLAVVLVLNGTLGGSVPAVIAGVYPGLADPVELLQGLSWCALLPTAYAFPDGRFVPSWTRLLVPAWPAFLAALLVLPDEIGNGPVVGVVAVALFGSCAFAQVHRYRKVSGPVERAQQRWVALAVALRFGYTLAITVTPLAGLIHEPTARGLVAWLVTQPVSYAISVALAAAVTVAIVRHRLYDVDIWITRTLVYSVLTTFVVGTYALVVSGIGALVSDGAGAVLPLVATVLVALAVDQVRVRAQRRVRRLVYGSRDDPYSVVAELGRRLGAAMPADAVGTTIVATVADALRLPHVELVINGTQVAVHGSHPPTGSTDSFALRHGDVDLGELRVTGDQLSAADRDLLTELARQAGVAVHGAEVTAALRRSRRELASSREEERRRLHRDLHDGLGPTLAGLYQRIDAAHRLVDVDPIRAKALLDSSRAQTLTTIGEIRELVDGLRPAVLDDAGLVGAIALAIERLAPPPGPPVVELAAPDLPTMPAGVEVAAYRIAVESVSNLVRHAHAAHATVAITIADGMLHVRVDDDGIGLGVPRPTGSGLRTMRERAEEIGGTMHTHAVVPHGTTVAAALPLTLESAP